MPKVEIKIAKVFPFVRIYFSIFQQLTSCCKTGENPPDMTNFDNSVIDQTKRSESRSTVMTEDDIYTIQEETSDKID